MAGNFLMPDNRFRSPTAIEGKSDMRDDSIYSALVIGKGASGQQKLFTVPQGQAIPQMGDFAKATLPAHHKIYTEVTTNLTKAGELGSSIGDASIRSIAITLEQKGINPADGKLTTWGASQYETAEILSKFFFQFKVAGKTMTQGPIWMYPAGGGAVGSIATAALTSSNVSNGMPVGGKRLKLPILIARTDTIEGVVGWM